MQAFIVVLVPLLGRGTAFGIHPPCSDLPVNLCQITEVRTLAGALGLFIHKNQEILWPDYSFCGGGGAHRFSGDYT